MSIGLHLSRRFFEAIVRPIVASVMPDLRYAAARLGDGSEVLGFDTEMSADHNYGPTVQLLLRRSDFDTSATQLMHALDRALPAEIDGWPIRFSNATRPAAGTPGTLCADHSVELHTLEAWTNAQLGIGPEAPIASVDWFAIPEQRFLTVTAGAVYRDDDGQLSALRHRLEWFPQEVWLGKLAAQWARIGEQQAFVGRAGEAGDDLGSRLIAARLVQDVMRLSFLIERRYAPYAKWFGAAFARLDCANSIGTLLASAVAANDWQERQRYLGEAYLGVGRLQCERAVPGAIAPELGPFHDRPFVVINAAQLAQSLIDTIEERSVKHLALAGAIDQFSDSTPLLAAPQKARRMLHATLD